MPTIKGLSSQEIETLQNKYGFNEIQNYQPISLWKIFFRQWESPLVWLLCVAAGLSYFLGDVNESVAIALIIAINLGIGFVQEWRAEKAILSLRKIVPQECKVIRNGILQTLPARELVPGDWVQLEAGDRVPADGIIQEQSLIAIDESILTGESYPVENTDSVKAGTYLIKGSLSFVVNKIGRDTEFGQTAGLLSQASIEVTPLQRRLAQLSQQILYFCLGVVLFVIGMSFYKDRDIWETLLFGISLLVASVPEGLPVMVSLGLALGVMRMARRQVLVRKLAAVETLGNVTYICTDKTGTLTQGQLELIETISDNIPECLRAALSCAEASVNATTGQGVGDPLEQAVARYALKQVGWAREDIEKNNPRVHVVPFDSETRTMKITRKDGWTYWKGAAEILWESLPQQKQNYWQTINQDWTAKGFRTLGVAQFKTSEDKKIFDLQFLGLLVFADPPRPEAKSAVAAAHDAGIETLMLTGDQELTAKSIAQSLGIKMFQARVKASDKLHRVRELKNQGHIVAMTGDGVNDGPALKEANVGVAMGLRGSEVAREASDLVLLDDNYASLVAAIQEGRGIFNNIRRSVSYLLIGNWGELILIVICSLLGMPLPLLASQLLWINLLTDGFPALVLMTEPSNSKLLRHPPRPLSEALLRFQDWRQIILLGSLEGFLVFEVFYESLKTHELEVARTLAFLVLVWSQVLRLIPFAQSLNFWSGTHQKSARFIWLCIVVSLTLQSMMIFFEWPRKILSLKPLTLLHWEEVLLVGFLLPMIMLLGRMMNKKKSKNKTVI